MTFIDQASSDIQISPIPTPPGPWLLGNAAKIKPDPLNKLLETANQYGDIIRLRMGPWAMYFLNHPAFAQHILQDNYKIYQKHTRAWNQLRPLLGEGLLTSDGATWLRQRRMLQPAFHHQVIAGFAETMVKHAEAMMGQWEACVERNEEIDIAAEMMGITFRIVTSTLFSVNLSADVDRVRDGLEIILNHASENYKHLVNMPLWVPTPRNRKVLKALEKLDKIVLSTIDSRRKSGKNSPDLLSLLMQAIDEETGETLTDKELRDQVMTIFMTGHETTANALIFAWYLLSKNPGVERKMSEELERVLDGRSPTFQDLAQLRYTTMVFKETIRLYPPVWVFGRKAIKDDVIGDYRIAKGSHVFVCPYTMHRDTRFWDNPEGFDPDRFASSTIDSLPRFAYMPFGGGPRQCIGMNFALMEGPLILATVAQKYRLNLLPQYPLEINPTMTLRPRNGLKMRVTTKKSKHS